MSNEGVNPHPQLQNQGLASAHGPAGPYWSQPSDCLLAALKSTTAGLSTEEARRRLQQFGPNSLKVRRRATALGWPSAPMLSLWAPACVSVNDTFTNARYSPPSRLPLG